jgi:hypothetical protein
MINSNGLKTNNFSNTVEDLMTLFRTALDKLFITSSNLNSKIIYEQLKEREINIDKINKLFNELPKGEWNIKVFFDNINQLNEIFGVSNEEILKYSIEDLDKKNLEEIRWQLLIESMLEYTKFSQEFYDALKYNINNEFSDSKLKLLNEFMLTFKKIKKESQLIYDKYKNKKISSRNKSNFNSERIPIEFLTLRIFYIIINLKNIDDNDYEYYSKLLSLERISISYQKTILKK